MFENGQHRNNVEEPIGKREPPSCLDVMANQLDVARHSRLSERKLVHSVLLPERRRREEVWENAATDVQYAPFPVPRRDSPVGHTNPLSRKEPLEKPGPACYPSTQVHVLPFALLHRHSEAQVLPALSKQIVLEDAPDRLDAVLPVDLLAFGVGAAAVGDPHLVDPAAQLRHLGGDLRLEAEAVLLDPDLARITSRRNTL